MTTTERNTSRRSLLKAGAVAGLAFMARPLFNRTHAQVQAARINAAPTDAAPIEPNDTRWSSVSPTLVSLSPQNLVVPRLTEAGATEIDVRALYDSQRISFLIEWKDAHKDSDLGTVMQYRDGVALQFPQDPAAGTTSIMMGQRNRGVTIYHWKSDWQFGQLYDVDEAYPNMYGDWYQYSGRDAGEIPEASDYLTVGDKTYLTAAAAGNAVADPLVQEKTGPVQKMNAAGFGTIEPDDTQDAQGMGVWENGEWRIVISVPRVQRNFTFQEDSDVVPVAFAAWDGSRSERNGQKAYSQWQDMRLASPVGAPAPVTSPTPVRQPGPSILPPVFGGIGGAIAAAAAVLIGLRMRRSRSQSEQQEQ